MHLETGFHMGDPCGAGVRPDRLRRAGGGDHHSDTQICPAGQKVTIRMKPGSADTAVFLQPVEGEQPQTPEGTYLTGGAPVTLDAQRGVWYRVGIRGENPTDQEITVVLTVSGCEVRIP